MWCVAGSSNHHQPIQKSHILSFLGKKKTAKKKKMNRGRKRKVRGDEEEDEKNNGGGGTATATNKQAITESWVARQPSSASHTTTAATSGGNGRWHARDGRASVSLIGRKVRVIPLAILDDCPFESVLTSIVISVAKQQEVSWVALTHSLQYTEALIKTLQSTIDGNEALFSHFPRVEGASVRPTGRETGNTFEVTFNDSTIQKPLAGMCVIVAGTMLAFTSGSVDIYACYKTLAQA